MAVTPQPIEHMTPGGHIFTPSDDDPRVELRLEPSERWVIEQYPTERVDDTGDALVVEMVVTASPWLERLLLRLGDAAELLAVGPPLDLDLRRKAANRVLERYR
jgi:proteasome accessory factor C